MEWLYDVDKIKALALDKKLSGNELGKQAGISGPSMHDILSGKTKIVRVKTLAGIANALGVSIQDISKIKGFKGGQAGQQLQVEAMTAYAQLTPENQVAMLGMIRYLVQQQKKK